MFTGDYEHLAQANNNFRKVLKTGPNSQIVAMSLAPGEDIGEETHDYTDQIFLIADGNGEAKAGDKTRKVEEDSLVFVPAGTLHNITNTGSRPLKLLTFYCPPEHPDGTIHPTKEDEAK